MFGMFRAKVLQKENCIENVTDAVLNIWVDETFANPTKFDKIYQFSSQLSADTDTLIRLKVKKLQLICSVAHTLLLKEGVEDLLEPISKQVTLLIKDLLKQDIPVSAHSLLKEAIRLSDLRFSTNPKEAGQLIEADFSEFVFNFIPDKDDIDSRYLLYKQLSGLERAAVLHIGSALRKSKI